MKKIFNYLLFGFLLLSFLKFTPSILATEKHFTVILNQVRANECCNPGNSDNFKKQLDFLSNLDLSAHFALRYDTLSNQEFIDLVKNYPQFEYGALLEIIPSLTKQADVIYKSDLSQWHEAQNVFLIGYKQAERKKIIDSYMDKFKTTLGYYPNFSVAWMIDSWSLAYLKKEYGINVHQITREQFATDSYTLYGGPMNYPYWPSNNWVLIPQEKNFSQPLIIRQTIMDPVFNYGDQTNSYTSQPNDYAIRNDTIKYFEHLFNQAHDQLNQYTFTTIGIENSMNPEYQKEFFNQLKLVKKWQNKINIITTLSSFEEWLKNNMEEKISIYQGTSSQDLKEKAWWINTFQYRARLRLSQGELSLTDLRLYSQEFHDPYLNKTSNKFGWWIVPFVLDASRFYSSQQNYLKVYNDTLKNRPDYFGHPSRIVLAKEITNLSVIRQDQQIIFKTKESEIAKFKTDNIFLKNLQKNSLINSPESLNNLIWFDKENNKSWGFSQKEEDSFIKLTPFTEKTNLDQERKDYPQLLFPEFTQNILNIQKSYLHLNNTYAVAKRNPVRLVFFPKDLNSQTVILNAPPKVTTNKKISNIKIYQQHDSDGMLFIDLENDDPIKIEVNFTYQDFTKDLTVYFSPNCTKKIVYCLTHPQHSFWYLRSIVADRLRVANEEKYKKALFIEQ